MARAMTGSCLCAGVRFEIAGEPLAQAYCHCSNCRKAHGSAFRAGAVVRAADFRWLAGEALVTGYASSPGIRRTFCRTCGSPLVASAEAHPDVLSVSIGALDDHPAIRPQAHWNVASKAPWHEITDGLPQYPIFPGPAAET